MPAVGDPCTVLSTDGESVGIEEAVVADSIACPTGSVCGMLIGVGVVEGEGWISWVGVAVASIATWISVGSCCVSPVSNPNNKLTIPPIQSNPMIAII